tara:strand:+ start:576 stop:1037 length:462 start_codon:yes stop_codon:yes gene_type:complete
MRYKFASTKKSLVVLFLWLVVFSNSNAVLGRVIKIEFTEFDTYSLEVIHINVGDTVEWLPTNSGHNVEFIITPQMVPLPEKSKMNEFHSMIFEEAGMYVYGCTPHLNTGMLGLIVVGNDFHNIKDTQQTKLSPVANSVLERLVAKAKSEFKGD